MSVHSVVTRAPGKLFLSGEYAVVYGATALVRAVDRYVEVQMDQAPGASVDVEIVSPGTTLAPLHARWSDHRLEFGASDPGHQLLISVLDALCDLSVLTPAVGPVHLRVDSQQLFHDGRKLGLGSSAAITHAVSRAVSEFAAEVTGQPAQLPDGFAFTTHRQAQQGRGSGADLGAGTMGGTYWYRREKDGELPAMGRVRWPEGLYWQPVWVGRPASTSHALAAVDDFQQRHPAAFAAALEALKAGAETTAEALIGSDSDRFVERCRAYSHNLSEFGRTVGVDIMSAAHLQLATVAEGMGLVYKPSGAGNGDIGIAFSNEINTLQQFTRELDGTPFTPLRLQSGRACHRVRRPQ